MLIKLMFEICILLSDVDAYSVSQPLQKMQTDQKNWKQ